MFAIRSRVLTFARCRTIFIWPKINRMVYTCINSKGFKSHFDIVTNIFTIKLKTLDNWWRDVIQFIWDCYSYVENYFYPFTFKIQSCLLVMSYFVKTWSYLNHTRLMKSMIDLHNFDIIINCIVILYQYLGIYFIFIKTQSKYLHYYVLVIVI